VEHVFEPRLVAVGPVSVRDIDTYDGIGDLRCFLRPDDHAGIAGEILVAGDAAKCETKPHAGLCRETRLHLDSLKSDVVGIFKDRYAARAVKSDIELARQTIQRPFVENVEVPLARVRARVDQFMRVNAGSRRARHVPDVVGAGPARAEAEILDRLHDADGIL